MGTPLDHILTNRLPGKVSPSQNEGRRSVWCDRVRAGVTLWRIIFASGKVLKSVKPTQVMASDFIWKMCKYMLKLGSQRQKLDGAAGF